MKTPEELRAYAQKFQALYREAFDLYKAMLTDENTPQHVLVGACSLVNVTSELIARCEALADNLEARSRA